MHYLIDGEIRLTESEYIMRYIARKYQPDLLGSSVAEFGKIFVLLDKVAKLKKKATTASEDPEAVIE